MLQRVPQFKSVQEEAEWWDKTDTSEWMNEGEWVEAGSGRLSEDRCPHCYSRRHVKRFNLKVADGRMTLHRIKGYYCPSCKITEPAPGVQNALPNLLKAAKELLL
ncbi:hypothetical protein HYR99_09820 [Candidatus Poribacteria bacterium]|nr:hypothetical protein [Candidatus Poribacteria bacterium]